MNIIKDFITGFVFYQVIVFIMFFLGMIFFGNFSTVTALVLFTVFKVGVFIFFTAAVATVLFVLMLKS